MKKLLVLALMAVTLVSTSITAEAKVYNYDITEENFDAVDYANRYADVKAAFGDDKAKLYNHYKFFGVEEGRIVKINKDVLTSQLNAESDIVAYKIFALDILKTIITDDMTDAQKVKAVEAWMKANITLGTTEDGSGNRRPCLRRLRILDAFSSRILRRSGFQPLRRRCS